MARGHTELTQEEMQLRVVTLTKLRENKGNIAKTSRDTGIARSTVKYWFDQNKRAAKKVKQERAKSGEKSQDEQEAIARGVQELCKLEVENLESLAAEITQEMRLRVKNENVKFSELTGGLSTAFDKAQIMKGEPTSINRMIGNLSEEEKAKRVAEIMEKARQRRLTATGTSMALVPDAETHGNGSNHT